MVHQLADKFEPELLLIEDAASGQQLIQTLAAQPKSGTPIPIPCKPNSDKVTRMSACTAMIESGSLVLPYEAPWLPEFETELLKFPHDRYDDQADALVQALIWYRDRPKYDHIKFDPNAFASDEQDPDFEYSGIGRMGESFLSGRLST